MLDITQVVSLLASLTKVSSVRYTAENIAPRSQGTAIPFARSSGEGTIASSSTQGSADATASPPSSTEGTPSSSPSISGQPQNIGHGALRGVGQGNIAFVTPEEWVSSQEYTYGDFPSQSAAHTLSDLRPPGARSSLFPNFSNSLASLSVGAAEEDISLQGQTLSREQALFEARSAQAKTLHAQYQEAERLEQIQDMKSVDLHKSTAIFEMRKIIEQNTLLKSTNLEEALTSLLQDIVTLDQALENRIDGSSLSQGTSTTVSSPVESLQKLMAMALETQGSKAGILSAVILNAAMIPGWPAPPPFAPAIGSEKARLLLGPLLGDKAMDETKLAEYLANFSAGQELLRKIKALLGEGAVQGSRKVFGWLTNLVAAIESVLKTLHEEIEDILAHGQQEERDEEDAKQLLEEEQTHFKA